MACTACLPRQRQRHGGECTVQTPWRAQVGGACAHVSLPRGRRGRAMDWRGEWFILCCGTLSSPPFGSARTTCHRLDARVWDLRSMRGEEGVRGGRGENEGVQATWAVGSTAYARTGGGAAPPSSALSLAGSGCRRGGAELMRELHPSCYLRTVLPNYSRPCAVRRQRLSVRLRCGASYLTSLSKTRLVDSTSALRPWLRHTPVRALLGTTRHTPNVVSKHVVVAAHAVCAGTALGRVAGRRTHRSSTRSHTSMQPFGPQPQVCWTFVMCLLFLRALP